MSKSSKLPAPALPPIAGVPQQVLIHLLNSAALGSYDECCSIEDIAQRLGKKPGSVRRAVTVLHKKGYVTTAGEILETVYPTVAALRKQDPSLSELDAKRILKRIMA